jgi:adenylate kinase family enzyme
MVIGCSGSGKSSFSRKLSIKLKLPLIHLDQKYWKPGWVEPEKAEWKRKMEKLVEKEKWVLDGNYGGTMNIRIERADAIVF